MEVIRPEGHYYELIEALGEGLNSCVYSALKKDPRTGLKSNVALKILKSESLLELWRSEFVALSQVRSPYCVSVYGWEWVKGCPALVLEFVDGVSLETLSLQSDLNPGLVYELIRQIQSGLDDLRQMGLCHGDLSPQNVLVDRKGQIRLIDFGLSNRDKKMATPRFAAPEVLAGKKATSMSDMYSVGRLAKYLLKNRPVPKCWKKKWFHPVPEKRSWVNWPTSPIAQGSLARLVENIKEQQTKEGTCCFEGGTAVSNRRSLWCNLAWIIVAMGLGSLSAQATGPLTQEPALLKVSGKQWKYIWLNGEPKGYGPFETHLWPGQKVKLKIRHHKGSEQRTLTPRAGETILVSDSQPLD